jgi:hypothetical protein
MDLIGLFGMVSMCADCVKMVTFRVAKKSECNYRAMLILTGFWIGQLFIG